MNQRAVRLSCRYGLLGLLLCAGSASAQSPAADDGVLESTRQSVRSTAEWLARGVDSWFGDKPFTDGGSVTEGKLSLGLLRRPPENAGLNLRFNARFRLPNLEERTYFFVGRDNPRELIEDKPGAFTRQQRLQTENDADNAFFAGLGLSLRDSVDLRLGIRGGLKPYVQARYRQPWQLTAADLVEFRQTFFWTVDDHLGSTTALSYEHAFSDRLAGRWLTSATVTRASGRLEWSSNVGVHRSYGGQRVAALEWITSGAQHTGVDLTDVGLQARWEQPVYKDWLLGEVMLGRFWPRADASVAREGAWAAGAVVKMKF